MIHGAARSSLSSLVPKDPTALIGRARHQLHSRLDRKRRIIFEAATEPYDDGRGAPIETTTSRYPCQLFRLARYSCVYSFMSIVTSSLSRLFL
jgi:transposase